MGGFRWPRVNLEIMRSLIPSRRSPPRTFCTGKIPQCNRRNPLRGPPPAPRPEQTTYSTWSNNPNCPTCHRRAPHRPFRPRLRRGQPPGRETQARSAQGSVPPGPVGIGRASLVQNRRMGSNTDRAGCLGGDGAIPRILFRRAILGLAFLGLLLGGAVAAVLSYPIVITLERPVRVTPEQAVQRLLYRPLAPLPSLQAHVAVAQHGGSGLDGLRLVRGIQDLLERSAGAPAEGHASRITPLVFVVADFKSEKSAGVSGLTLTSP